MELSRRQFFPAAATIAVPFLLNPDAFGDEAALAASTSVRARQERGDDLCRGESSHLACRENRHHRLRHVGRSLVQVGRGPRGRDGRADERDAQGGPGRGRVHHPRAQHLHRFLQGHAAAQAGARQAPVSPDAGPAGHRERWGTAWCWPDAKREGGPADRRLRHGLRLQGEVRDPRRLDPADRRHRDRRGRRHHRQRPGDLEPARQPRDRQRDPLRRAPEHVRARPAVRHPADGAAWARTSP